MQQARDSAIRPGARDSGEACDLDRLVDADDALIRHPEARDVACAAFAVDQHGIGPAHDRPPRRPADTSPSALAVFGQQAPDHQRGTRPQQLVCQRLQRARAEFGRDHHVRTVAQQPRQGVVGEMHLQIATEAEHIDDRGTQRHVALHDDVQAAPVWNPRPVVLHRCRDHDPKLADQVSQPLEQRHTVGRNEVHQQGNAHRLSAFHIGTAVWGVIVLGIVAGGITG